MIAVTEEEIRQTLPEEYWEFASLFSQEENDKLPEHGEFDHEIPLMNAEQPKAFKAYRMSPKEAQTVQERIKEWLEKGYIRESKSTAACPVLFAPKKDGSLRMCVDYRHLNAITIKHKFPLPIIEEMLNKIAGKRYVTKYDIPNAYHRLFRMKNGEEWKTGFITSEGYYEYVVMPFGLTGAPATLQRFMIKVLAEFLNKFVVV